jgi:hypothetical protein
VKVKVKVNKKQAFLEKNICPKSKNKSFWPKTCPPEHHRKTPIRRFWGFENTDSLQVDFHIVAAPMSVWMVLPSLAQGRRVQSENSLQEVEDGKAEVEDGKVRGFQQHQVPRKTPKLPKCEPIPTNQSPFFQVFFVVCLNCLTNKQTLQAKH